MKTFYAVLVLVFVLAAGCSREPQAATDTIAPAEPRPAPPVTPAIGDRSAIDTAGSPRPASAAAPGTTFVTVAAGRIDVQRLLPRGHAVFHVRNATGVAHELVVRGGTGSADASLPPGGTTALQLLLGTGSYEIACTTPGHEERARFETYTPGASLQPPVKAPVRR